MQNYSELRNHPIFICGHPKAGTSLMLSILDSHPQLVVYPEESIFFRRFLPEATQLNLQEAIRLAEKEIIHIFTWSRQNPPPSQEGYPDRDYSYIDFNSVKKQMHRLVSEEYKHPGDILSAAVIAFGQVSKNLNTETMFWVEKSPYNEYFAEKIFAWWPEARCIHVLRDPRDNYVSYRRKHPDWQPEFFAMNWKRSTQTGMRNQREFGEHRYQIIKYENLVLEPEKTIQKLVQFLGIQWEPSLTSPTKAGESWRGNSMFMDEFDGISRSPIARWKEHLTQRDAALIEYIAKPLMQKLSYEILALKSFSPLQRMPIVVRARTWHIRKRFFVSRSLTI